MNYSFSLVITKLTLIKPIRAKVQLNIALKKKPHTYSNPETLTGNTYLALGVMDMNKIFRLFY